MLNVNAKTAMALNSYQKTPTISKNDDNNAIKEKTDQFEAIIIKMLLDESMKETKGLYTSSKDPGDKIYKSMYRDELSKASAGGFGFSQMLYENLTQNQAKSTK